MADFTGATKTVSNELACSGCGATLKFKPGTLHLACEYCGHKNEIASAEIAGQVEEFSLEDFLQQNLDAEEKITAATVHCNACGATTTLAPSISSDRCPFCGVALVVNSGSVATLHKPQYVLPFGVDQAQAKQHFVRWLKKLWFAPSDLIHYGNSAERLNGMYLPFWTFDCNTFSNYTGQRGEHYYVSETYTTIVNGKSEQRVRQVQRTRWYSVSGSVSNTFDDLIIEGSTSLNKKKLRALEPWDLNNLMPYDDKYLSGFCTETYAVDVKAGYAHAKERMEPVISDTVRTDIGGDTQRIHYINTTYRNPTFKHILLPVWISAFRYKGKTYQILVNARTGEVQGDRPFSAVKIMLAVLAGLAIAVLIWLVSVQ